MLLVDWRVSRNYVWPQRYFCSWNHLYYDDMDDELLVFGSSRAQVHFSSKIITDSLGLKTYNFGLPGASINYSYIQLREILKHRKTPPRYVTLEVCFHTLMPRPLPYHYQMMPKMLFNVNMFRYHGNNDVYPTGYFFVPMLRYFNYWKDLDLFNKETYYTCDGNGYIGEGSTYNSKRNSELANLSKTYIPYDEKQYGVLKKFIKTCKENNISLLLVWTPEYYKYLDNLKERAELEKCFEGIAKDNSIPFVNFVHSEICNDSLNFENAMHLNANGSEKFTSEFYVPTFRNLYGL